MMGRREGPSLGVLNFAAMGGYVGVCLCVEERDSSIYGTPVECLRACVLM